MPKCELDIKYITVKRLKIPTYLVSEYLISSLSLSLKINAATGIWEIFSVILSTSAITLSTLSRYLPKVVILNDDLTFYLV